MDASSESNALRQRVHEWLAADPDPTTVQELKALLASADPAAWEDLKDRFSGALEFGTAGLRGVIGAGPNRMNRAVVRKTAWGVAQYLLESTPDAVQRGVVVGRDGRTLSWELAHDTAEVLAARGIPVHFFPDVVPTPLVAFATRRLNAAAGVMVTASHNPPEYNGFKVYAGNGAQIIPPQDLQIAGQIERAGPAKDIAMLASESAKAAGLWRELGSQMGEAYQSWVLSTRRHPQRSSLKIAYTALHGVGGPWVESVFRKAGFPPLHVVTAQHTPNAAFPTVRFPNPEEPGALDLVRALAKDVGAELVLANDPDADRLAVVVPEDGEGWRQLSGNEVGVLLGHYLLTQGERPENPLVISTIVSSAQLRQIAQDLGVAYEETLTGFKWISNRGLAREQEGRVRFLFGYEEALGYCVGGGVRDKDGISAAMVFADMAAWCQREGIRVVDYLERIARRHGLFLSDQRNFVFPGSDGRKAMAQAVDAFRSKVPSQIGEHSVVAMHDYLTGLTRRGESQVRLSLPPSNVVALELADGGRVTLRPSGTEPKLKFYFELKETLAPEESLQIAQSRGRMRLSALINAFLALSKERGLT